MIRRSSVIAGITVAGLLVSCKRPNPVLNAIPVTRDAYRRLSADDLPLSWYREKKAITPVDLSSDMPPVMEQGSKGSCTAFGVAYYAMSYLEKTAGGYPYLDASGQLDKSTVFSPSFSFNGVKATNSDPDCASGIAVADAASFISKYGNCRLSQYRYVPDATRCESQPGPVQFAAALPYKHFSFRTVGHAKEYIQNCLNTSSPVIAEILIDSRFEINGYAHHQGFPQEDYIWNPPFNDFGDCHIMTIVGYYPATRQFKLVNSYGTYWGKEGYCLVNDVQLLGRTTGLYRAVLTPGTQALAPDSSMQFNKRGYQDDNKKIHAVLSNAIRYLELTKHRTEKQKQLLSSLQVSLKSFE